MNTTEPQTKPLIGQSLSNAELGLSSPQYAGQWQIGGRYGLYISVRQKPKWITQWLCRKLLEWEWIDTPSVELTGRTEAGESGK